MPLTLRKATIADADYLLVLRNEPETRAMCHSTEEISHHEHLCWMARRLDTDRDDVDRTCLYVAEVDGVPVGTGRIERAWVRISPKLDACKVGYALASSCRGHGLGKALVAALVTEAHRMGYATILCKVRRGNIKSVVCAMMSGVNSVEFF